MSKEKKCKERGDPPTKQFLKESIAKERDAIESYMKEAERTNDTVLKTALKKIAVDEMTHLELLEAIEPAKEQEK